MISSVIAEQLLDFIADSLENPGYIILPAALPPVLADALLLRVKSFAPNDWQRAGIGRKQSHRSQNIARTDNIHWLDNNNPAEIAYAAWMECLRLGLNRRLFLGLFDYENHFAVYAKGDYYQKHLDAFKGKPNRVVTTVFYLNPQIVLGEGGELLIYPPQGDIPLARVQPNHGKLVIFLSARFPHEVVLTQQTRYSIAGWFSLNSSHLPDQRPVDLVN